MTFYNALKNILLLLIVLQIAPPLIQGIKKQYTTLLEPHTKIGVISFDDMITDSSCIVKQLNSLFKNEEIKALFFKMDCRGSTSASGQTIYDEILWLKKRYPKPIVTLVENVCASGGYWIASASDTIIAPGSALIGSIGVAFMYNFKLQELLEQYHIKYNLLKAGDYKGATDPFSRSSSEENTMLQAVLDDTYAQFVQAVAASRNLPLATSSEWANGRLFTARQGLQLGLIDQLGSMNDAVRILREKAGIEGRIEWVKEPTQKSWWLQLFDLKPDCSSMHGIISLLSYNQKLSTY